jgi:hypothetical protein
VADFVRSCYRTKMVTDASGVQRTVDWFFASPGAPFLPRHVFGSLNWSKPDYGSGTPGEVIGATRPWRDGSPPAYFLPDATFPRLGSDADFAGGAGGPLSAPPPIDYAGRRKSAAGDAMDVFPAWIPAVIAPPLASSVWGLGSALPVIPGRYSWSWPGRPYTLAVSWTKNDLPPLFSCYPGIAAMQAVRGGTLSGYLRCVSYDTVNGVSLWDDPAGQFLNSGEVLSLNSSAAIAGEILVLLEQHTASNSPALNFTGCISSSYDLYQIDILGIVPVNANVNVGIQLSTNGGASYDTANNYGVGHLWGKLGSAGSGETAAVTSMWGFSNVPNLANGASRGCDGRLLLFNPLSTVLTKHAQWDTTLFATDPATFLYRGSGYYDSAVAVNAFRVVCTAGNIAAGTVRVYGVPKS